MQVLNITGQRKGEPLLFRFSLAIMTESKQYRTVQSHLINLNFLSWCFEKVSQGSQFAWARGYRFAFMDPSIFVGKTRLLLSHWVYGIQCYLSLSAESLRLSRLKISNFNIIGLSALSPTGCPEGLCHLHWRMPAAYILRNCPQVDPLLCPSYRSIPCSSCPPGWHLELLVCTVPWLSQLSEPATSTLLLPVLVLITVGDWILLFLHSKFCCLGFFVKFTHVLVFISLVSLESSCFLLLSVHLCVRCVPVELLADLFCSSPSPALCI